MILGRRPLGIRFRFAFRQHLLRLKYDKDLSVTLR